MTFKVFTAPAERVILLVLFLCCLGLFGERIAGLGFDGIYYGSAAQDLPAFLQSPDASDYRIKRLLPSSIVWLCCSFCRVELLHRNQVVAAFLALTLVAIIVTLYTSLLTTRRERLSPRAAVLFIAALCCNYPVVKMGWYYPTLTDIPALCISTLMLYCYVTQRRGWLCVLATAGALTFPTLPVTGMLLLMFPASHGRSDVSYNSKAASAIVALLAAGAYVAAVLWLFLRFSKLEWLNQMNTTAPVEWAFFWPSLVFTSCYIFLVVRYVLTPDLHFLSLTTVERVRVMLLAILPWITASWIVKELGSGDAGFSSWAFFKNLLHQSVTYPCGATVAHIHYFGPVLLLLVLLQREVGPILARLGPGIQFVLLFHGLLAIGSESRQLIAGLPFVALVVSLAADRRALHWNQVWLIVAAQLIYSRFWFSINNGGILQGDFLSFPYQRYFMMQGPWASKQVYAVHLMLVAVTYGVFRWVLGRSLLRDTQGGSCERQRTDASEGKSFEGGTTA